MKAEVWLTEIDGTRVAPLPTASFSGELASRLNAPGETSLRLDPHHLAGHDLTDREIQIWEAGEPDPLLVGVPWLDSRARGGRALSIGVAGLESYLARRFISDDLEFEDVEQFDIAWSLIDWTQDEVSGDLNIDPAAYAPSGIDRTRRYFGDELACVLDELASFPTINDGFDWAILPVGGDRREWTPFYPERGALHAEWRLHKLNVASWGWSRDRTRITRRHFATASGEGTSKLIGRFTHPDTQAGNLLLLESVSSASSSIRHEATLTGKAVGQVAARQQPTLTIEAEVKDSAIARGVQPGDTLPVTLSDEAITVAENMRVIEKVLRTTTETAVLTLVRTLSL